MKDSLILQLILSIIDDVQKITSITNDNEKIAYFRDNIRKKIFFLQEDVLSNYSQNICDIILFTIVSFVDEKIMLSNLSNSNLQWDLLQVEYYNRNDGGEYFFNITEKIISDNIFPKICFITILLLLDSGYLGKFHENPYNNRFTFFRKEVYRKIKQMDNKLEVDSIFDTSLYKSSKKKKNKLLLPVMLVTFPVATFVIGLILLTNL